MDKEQNTKQCVLEVTQDDIRNAVSKIANVFTVVIICICTNFAAESCIEAQTAAGPQSFKRRH